MGTPDVGTRVRETVDAIVIGGGHNGLVAASVLADAGWDVVVLEAQSEPGGAVRSAELVPGFVADLYSAFYPLSQVSPAILGLGLEDYGLTWSHAPVVVGHPLSSVDVDAPVLLSDPQATADLLAQRDPRDGATWSRLCEQWQTIKEPLVKCLFSPFPPVRGPIQLLRSIGTAEAIRLARFLMLPASAMATELFHSDAARVLLLGNAMHADVPPDAPGSGVMGYLLTMLAQDTGYPVPVGGAGRLTTALADRARHGGAEIRCATKVVGIDVHDGRAVGVRTEGGQVVRARRAIIADVSAPTLYSGLLPRDSLPTRLLDDLKNFAWDTPVLKVNYALDEPIPWRSANLRGAGTIHVGADPHELVRWMADLNTNVIPEKPFMLFGQMTTADSTRSPKGTESAWAYTHLPRGVVDNDSADLLADRVDDVLEAYAPGFRARAIGRVVQRPSDLESADANLHGGAVNGGTAQLQQQLIFRPVPGTGRSETPVEGLYLGSASAHPGGGVHGMCGLNAANAALKSDGARGWPRRRLNRSITNVIDRS